MAFLTTVLLSDLAATVLMGAANQLPLAVIVSMALVRPVVLFFAFGGLLWLTTRSAPPNPARFVGAFALFYLLFPICVWALKPGHASVAAMYYDLYTKAGLFAIVRLPFLLASSIGVYVATLRNRPKPERNTLLPL